MEPVAATGNWEEGNDSFSEQAKHKYLNSNDVNHDDKIVDFDDQYQWNIPDVESGAYLNTLESKLYKLTNGRGLGKSLRMGTYSTVSTVKKSKRKIEYSDGSKKCVDYFEEEIDLANVPKDELIGATPLLESESENENVGESSEAVGFEDLQIKELEEDYWHQDYVINEEEKQILYDKKTGELKQEVNSVIMNMETKVADDISDEESESEDEDEEDQDEYNTMELHDNEEENDHFEPYQINTTVENDEDDWEAEFP